MHLVKIAGKSGPYPSVYGIINFATPFLNLSKTKKKNKKIAVST